MILCTNTNVGLVPVLSVNNDYGDYLTYKDMISKRTALDEITKLEDVSFYLTLSDEQIEGVKIPVLVCLDGGDIVDVTQLYSALEGMTVEEDSEELSLVTSTLNALIEADVINDEISKLFLESRDFISKFLTGQIQTNIRVSEKFNTSYDVQLAVKDYNLTIAPTYLKNNFNEFMSTPESKVNLAIPSIDDIKVWDEDRFGNPSYSVSKYDLFNPYNEDLTLSGDALMQTPNYKLNTTEYPTAINRAKDANGNKFSVEDIVGYYENDKLPLQANEKIIYKRLVRLINDYIANEGLDLHEVREHDRGLNLIDIKNGKVDRLFPNELLDYLTDMAVKLTALNWSHSGLLSEGLAEEESGYDEEGNEKETATEEGSSRLWSEKAFKNGVVILGDDIIKSTLEKAMLVDIYSVVDYIIRVLRWGNRKPSRILIGALGNLYLNLTTMISSDREMQDTSEVLEIDGCRYSFGKFIKLKSSYKSSKASELGYEKSMDFNVVVGVQLVTEFKSGARRYSYLSVNDFVRLLKKEPNCVYGFKLNGDKFEVDQTINQAIAENENSYIEDLTLITSRVGLDSTGKDHYIVSDSFKSLCKAFKMRPNKKSELCVLKDIFSRGLLERFLTTYNYTDIEEAVEAIGEGVNGEDAFEGAVMNNSLMVVLDVINELDGMNPHPVEVLNMYLNHNAGNGNEYSEFLTGEEQASDKLERLDLFGVKPNLKEEDEIEVKKSEIYEAFHEGVLVNKVYVGEYQLTEDKQYILAKLVNKNKPEKGYMPNYAKNYIGYTQMIKTPEGKVYYIVAKNVDTTKFEFDKASLDFNVLRKTMVADMPKIILGQGSPKIKYVDEESLTYYATLK